MEKPIAAIEFGSKKLKLVIGYELNGQVYVIYSLTKPYGRCVDGFDFLDEEKIESCIREICQFTDVTSRMRISITEALLAIPPYGLQVFDTRQVTGVSSEDRTITHSDLVNIYNIIRNSFRKMNNVSLVDFLPECFITDNDKMYATLPVGIKSSDLAVVAKIHSVPKNLAENYEKVLNKGGMRCKKTVVAPCGAIQLLSTYNEIPSDYLLVDVGACMTTISLVGHKQLFSSVYFPWGGDSITERIRESFNINETDAEKYKIMYGINNRKMNFDAPVCVTTDYDGTNHEHKSEELNEIIIKELDLFVDQLNKGINDLLRDYEQSYKSLSIVLVGGGSRLNGFVDYLKEKMPFNDDIIAVTPKSLGARNATFTNCLGMILANAKNPCINDENHPRISPIERVSNDK